MEKTPHALPRTFVRFRGALCERIHAPMHRGVIGVLERIHRVDDGLRLVSCSGRVEVCQLRLSGEERELPADGRDIEQIVKVKS